MLINCPECDKKISDQFFFVLDVVCRFVSINRVSVNERNDNKSLDNNDIVSDKIEQRDIGYLESIIGDKIILTVPEIRDWLNIGINQAYDLVKSEQFVVKHIGKKLVIPVKSFVDWFENQ